MRVNIVLSDGHAVGIDPVTALGHDRELVAAAREGLGGVTLHHGWATAPRWNLQAITFGAFLGVDAGPLHLTIRDLPVGVANPIELAEQLATVDHAWRGRFSAGITVGTPPEFAAFGLDPATGPARFSEGVGLMRRMWRLEPFAGEGPVFVFGEVRPTLRPVQDGGPPLALGVVAPDDARAAASHGLGVHLGLAVGPADREHIVAAYREAGGDGELSVAIRYAEARRGLAPLVELGFLDVDVVVRDPGDDPSVALERVAALAAGADNIT